MKSKIIIILFALSVIIMNLTARYDPDTGRFVSADSVTPGGGADSQGLNRYSYCDNNPVKYVDPTGHAENEPDTSVASYFHKISTPLSYWSEQSSFPKSAGQINAGHLVDSLSNDMKSAKGAMDYVSNNSVLKLAPFLSTFMQMGYAGKKENYEKITGESYDRVTASTEGNIAFAMAGLEMAGMPIGGKGAWSSADRLVNIFKPISNKCIIDLPRMLTTEEIANLSKHFGGVEFAQGIRYLKENGTTKGRIFLQSGTYADPDIVNFFTKTKNGPTIFINHTHNNTLLGAPGPSGEDVSTLDKMMKNGSGQKASYTIPIQEGGKHIIKYDNKGHKEWIHK